MQKVLVVDDSQANRLVIAALLRRAGYEVLLAASPSEALSVAQSAAPTAVLTDLHMAGEMDGIELARTLRQQSTGGQLRIAIMTGDAAETVHAEGVADAVLEKPVMLNEIKAFLEEKNQ